MPGKDIKDPKDPKPPEDEWCNCLDEGEKWDARKEDKKDEDDSEEEEERKESFEEVQFKSNQAKEKGFIFLKNNSFITIGHPSQTIHCYPSTA